MPKEARSPATRCAQLVKRYGELNAVDHLDLDIFEGECFGLLGPNGAGKTTTVEMIEGLTAPDGGSIELFGQRWGAGDDDALRQRLGIQLQETQLADKLTVREVAELFHSFYNRGQTVDAVIAEVELESKATTRFHQLSGGQKQRLALACALVGEPDLLFLDEPTTGLDPQARLKVWEVVERFKNRGGTVVLTTHYMEEAASLCDRLAVMEAGKIIALGTPDELIAMLGADQIVELETEPLPPAAAFTQTAGVTDKKIRVKRVVLSVTDIAAAMPAILEEVAVHKLTLKSLETHHATLEDVYVHLTGRGLRDA